MFFRIKRRKLTTKLWHAFNNPTTDIVHATLKCGKNPCRTATNDGEITDLFTALKKKFIYGHWLKIPDYWILS